MHERIGRAARDLSKDQVVARCRAPLRGPYNEVHATTYQTTLGPRRRSSPVAGSFLECARGPGLRPPRRRARRRRPLSRCSLGASTSGTGRPRSLAARSSGGSGCVEEFEVVDASVGQVGARLQLRWRCRRARPTGWATAGSSSSSTSTPPPAKAAGSPGMRLAVLRVPPESTRWLNADRRGAAGTRPPATTRIRTSAGARQCPVQQVRLADGHQAWLVLGHEAARAGAQGPAGCRRTWSPRSNTTRRRGRGPSRPRVLPAHAQRRPARPHPAAPSRVARPSRRHASPRSNRRSRRIAGELLDELEAAGPGSRRRPGRRLRPSRCRSA